MSALAQWLTRVGLEQYSSVFAANGVDLDTLRLLTDSDLHALGVLLGHRRKLRRALADAFPSPPTDDGARSIASVTAGGERRQVSVLFGDLVGSTELAARLDPEQLKALLARFTGAVSRAVTRYDGYLYQVLGDGVVAYFGYPVAHEAEADRAIRAGLAAIEAVRALDGSGLPALHVRVGIATGLVVVAHVNAPDKLAVGETPNLAARLQAEAAPDSLVICERTRSLAAGAFDYHDLGLRQLKGVPAPRRIWQVIGPSPASSRFEAAARGTALPMVGREEELTHLLEQWKLASRGQGRTVVISGEPGIGKSRALLAMRQVLGNAPTTLQYQCSPYHTNTALYPILDQIARVLLFKRDESPEVQLDKVEAMVRDQGRPRLDARLISAALSLPVDERFGPLNWTPQRQKDETLRALIALTEAIARRRPALLLFEDVHWADPTTLELLDHGLRRFAAAPVLAVLTHRPEFTPPWTDWPGTSAVSLSRLGEPESVLIVERVAGGKRFPGGLTEQIVAKADGVPLFLEEITKSVLESDVLEDRGDHYAFARPVDSMTLPVTLRDSLMSRLDRLIPAKEVAQIGACLGREFSHELVAAVSAMTPDELNEALERLMASGLLSRRGTPSETTYVFKHALLQDAAYDSLLKSKRQELHSEIAGSIERLYPAKVAAEPELLAHHRTLAGDLARAIPLWQKAGELALSRVALNEAIAHLGRGLDLNASLPASQARDAAELDLRCLLGTAQIAMRSWAAKEVEEVMAPTLELARAIGKTDRLLPLLVRWCTASTRGRSRESLPWAREMLAEADRTGNTEFRVEGLLLALISHFWMGDLAAAERLGRSVLAEYDVAVHRRIVAVTNMDVRTTLAAYTGQYLWMLGFPDQAVAAHEEGVRHAGIIDHPFDTGFLVSFGAYLYWYRGEADAFERCLQQTERIAVEYGMPFFEEMEAATMRGLRLNLIGAHAEAIAHFERGIEFFTNLEGQISLPFLKAVYADSLAHAGRADRALAVLEECREQIERPGWEERCHLAEVNRLEGRVLEGCGDQQGAETRYRASLACARAQGARSWELRAATSLARLCERRGERTEARDILAPIYGWFTEGFDTRDLRDARALLDALA